MQYVHFLNLEYFIVALYNYLSGLEPVVVALPHGVVAIGWGIIFAGMALSLILLILIIYVQIRLVQVEHAGFHALEEHEHIEHEHAVHAEEPHARTRWDDIMELAGSGSQSDWRRAILEADIMLSDALAARGWEGATVADQLRMANPIQMTTLDLAWEAHKMRNRIAHEGERLQLTDRDVHATIDYYRRVFEELQVI